MADDVRATIAELRRLLSARKAADQACHDAVRSGAPVPAKGLFLAEMHLAQAFFPVADALLTAAERGAAGDGWRLVPVEPTHDMACLAGEAVNLTKEQAKTAYRTMIAAAPAAPASSPAADLRGRVAKLEAALREMEDACEALAAGRSQAAYDAMIAAGQANALLRLDEARRSARAALPESGREGS